MEPMYYIRPDVHKRTIGEDPEEMLRRKSSS